jgi:hypothetical protein
VSLSHTRALQPSKIIGTLSGFWAKAETATIASAHTIRMRRIISVDRHKICCGNAEGQLNRDNATNVHHRGGGVHSPANDDALEHARLNDVLVLVGKRGYFERRQVAVDVGDEGDAHCQSAGTGGVKNYRPSREILFQT